MVNFILKFIDLFRGLLTAIGVDYEQLRVISDIGFSELAKAYGADSTNAPPFLFPHGGDWTGPHFQFIPPKRNTIVKTDTDKTLFVMHAFGDGFDFALPLAMY